MKKKAKGRYHHGALREAALEAAAREVDAVGMRGFSLERVARALGVTPAALYRHYENREALLSETVWQGFTGFVAAMDASVAEDAAPVDVLRRAGRAFVRYAVKNPGWFRMQFSREGAALSQRQAEADPAYAAALFGAVARMFGDERAVVERWYLLVWTTLHGAASMAVEHVLPMLASDEERVAFADAVLDTHFEALEAAAARAKRRARA